MKNSIFYLIAILAFCSLHEMNAQVGVGTTVPNGALDVTSSNDGLLIPRVALAATNLAAPLTSPTVSELVYNTATVAGINGVNPGYYYWDGTLWIALSTGKNADWSLTGNSGTTAGTNFIGTTDAQDFRIKTGVGGVDRWNISNTNNGQLQSYALGTAALPAYSWQTDTNTGLFSPGADILGTATAGNERMRVEADGDVGIGTTAASYKLSIRNDQDGYGVMSIDNATAGGFSGVYFLQNTVYRGHIGYVNTGGASTFGGKGSYQLASGNRHMLFSTNSGSETYLERMIIAQDGRVGINTNPTNLSATIQPTSTLQVNGSVAVGVVRLNVGGGGLTYTVPGTISKVILDASGGGTLTVELPDPTTCAGRLISVSRGTGTKTITIDPVGGNNIQSLDGTIGNTTSLPLHSAAGSGVNIQFWSDGVIWYR
ncbi:hypothetical protein IP98_00566 [Flavobacterium cauense R2A-7]|uniref:Uncharacterized protein n=1 Tax=Flavobacterium cauense R2A-7 TaxID=1341154 RepID=A0A562M411_9FLAO|nr:hypothetical protein [Flavobacterium cauense]TWI14603.1 hypothetical protein IP98_00566 [Flavobacterium cauense R2A-7]